MKIAILTDTHFGARADHPLIAEKMIEFFERVFWPEIDKQEIKTIVHMGDIVDNRRHINFQTWENIAKQRFFNPIRERGIHLYHILGNHDIPFSSSKEPSVFSVFPDDPNIVKIRSFTSHVIGDLECLFLPWILPNEVTQARQVIEESTASVVFSHLSLPDFYAQIENSYTDHHKDFSLSDFGKFKCVFSGHIHKPQQIRNIDIVGSPYEITASDIGDQKGFLILDTKTLKKTKIVNPFSVYHVIPYSKELFPTVKEVENYDYTKVKGKWVRIEVLLDEQKDPYIFEKLLTEIGSHQPYKISEVPKYSSNYNKIVAFSVRSGEEKAKSIKDSLISEVSKILKDSPEAVQIIEDAWTSVLKKSESD